MIIPSARRALPRAIAIVAAAGGAFAALHYHRLGLTLSHYDARGHLIVARRIFDSITPGWQQIGAVWLPLPHVLNAVPVQIDFFYRTGVSAVVLSIAAFAIAAGAVAAILLSLTDSAAAAIAGAAVFALNPNVLYLQSTPMSEPLLLATMLAALALLVRFARPERVDERAVGAVLALACLTRYEAWPVIACALVATLWAKWRSGDAVGQATRAVARIAIFPAVAIAGFAIFSRVVIGEWFVQGGFFVPENKALGDPRMAANEIAWGLRAVSGPMLVWLGVAGTVLLVGAAVVSRSRAAALIPASLLAMTSIAWVAFVDGHPFRIRYAVPLVGLEAVAAGFLAGGVLRGRARTLAAIVVAAIAFYELRPLDAKAPMVVEAQWDRPNGPVRATVTSCLGAPGSGAKIMASMGSLGHYMQEASREGFAIRDFLHEGNGDIWLAALETPRLFADWMLIEEKAEGGDMLAKMARERPAFLDGYARVCEGAGLALYKLRSERSR